VVIIGGGVGGLATAARIAASASSISSSSHQQVEVIILEKNSYDYAGGRCGSYNIHIDNVGTFRHERGPSLLLLRQEYIRLFDDCCRDNGEISSRRRKTTTAATATAASEDDAAKMYQVIFDDGDVISLGFPSCVSFNDITGGGLLAAANDDERIKKNVQLLEQESIHKFNMLELNGYQKWCNYLNTCSAYLDCGLPNFIEQNLDLSSFPTFLYESVLNNNAMYWPLQPHSTMVSNIFTSTKLRALATFQDLYVGLEPNANHRQLWDGILRKTAPAVFGLLAGIELHPTNAKSGVFAPIGGFQQVIESMTELCTDLNVEIRYNTSVTRITTDGVHYIDRTGDNNRDGYLEADLIICNADVPYATETILKIITIINNNNNNYK
jgi:phytoene desaturase (3,4-didehydrolycopene-forming)